MNFKCYTTCPKGYYGESFGMQCKLCATECTSCFDHSASLLF